MSAVHDIAAIALEQIRGIRDVVLDPTLEFSRFESGVARVRLKPRFGDLAFCSSRGRKIYFLDSASATGAMPGDTILRVSAFPSGAYIGCCTLEFLPERVNVSRFSYVSVFYRSSMRGWHTLSFEYNSPSFIDRLLGTVAEFGVGSLATQELNHKRHWRRYRKKCV